MSHLRAQIMAAPPEDRLPLALNLLEEVTGGDDLQWLAARHGLSAKLALALAALNAAYPRPARRSAIYAALYGGGDERIDGNINVVIWKLRERGWRIITHRGVGWSLAERIEIEPRNRRAVDGAGRDMSRAREPWTDDDDAELLRMRAAGSDWWAISDEMGRSERACIDRHSRLTR